jgi:hypothetical protein
METRTTNIAPPTQTTSPLATTTNAAPARQAKGSFPLKRVSMAAAFILADVLAIYLMINYGNEYVKTLGLDTAKISIQLLLVVLFGGIFIQEYNRIRARKAAVNELRRTILRDLSRAYSDVKGVRRILRGNCEPIKNNETGLAEDCVPLTVYDEHISTINATQLDLEIMVRELRIVTGIFSEQDELSRLIKRMEKNLNRVIDEYEERVKLHRGATSIPLSKLPELNAFVVKRQKSDVDKRRESTFDEFVSSYQKALTIIQEERVKVG